MPKAARKRKGTVSELDNGEAGTILNSQPAIIDFEKILQASSILPEHVEGGQVEQRRDVQSGSSNSFLLHNDSGQQIRLINDPITAHVPKSLKEQIQKGEYINLALLLKGAVDLNEIISGGSLRLSPDGNIESRPRECKDKIGTIDKWSDAFLIFSTVYLEKHPDTALEILHYMFTIRECASHRGGYAWRLYDEQFRLRQAAMPSSWAQINNDLWWRCMLLDDRTAPPKQSSSMPKFTCNEFNNSNCRWPNCKFSHACANCGGQHPLTQCTGGTFKPAARSELPYPTFSPRGRGGYGNFRGRGRGFNRGGRQ